MGFWRERWIWLNAEDGARTQAGAKQLRKTFQLPRLKNSRAWAISGSSIQDVIESSMSGKLEPLSS